MELRAMSDDRREYACCVVKSFMIAGPILLFVFLATPVHAEKGQSSYKQGRDLEARQNYEAA